ncbi:TatD family hydrolase [Legionella oakridgensis]|uniref:Hydrolase, TatD family n=2 Tax=Legionella oakridgensis TaxID=29423 RepID=W0BA03_9GAMM|nr:TatD family hydrolase [Legionella oakridgensis]AHE66690.1 hydrolase, TatD family [Legionella oakridgensis ATCC 33761 = DSM 21215]KTD37720.1 deoxyribonuclease belonging to the TatD DNAse family protein [Legionella oakridgensis]STY19828.1 deoxyribonuclease belonging to the TatD DNAse family [Legionella longbeachae]
MNSLKPAPLIDSHCHLHSIDLSDFEHGMDEVLRQATDNGVQNLLCVCVETNDLPLLYKLADQYPHIKISAGIHPNSDVDNEPEVQQLLTMANHPSCIAIGETGLDYYRTTEKETKQKQQARFREHIRAAKISKKPLIIHTRDASDDTLSLLAEEHADEVGGVMHCFTETWEVARRALDLGFYISFSGIVTFKNATQLQDVARKVPSNRMLIETDSPYLAPVPFRGKQNHPALVKYVAQALSELRGTDYETIARQTTENFYHCFRVIRTED